mmetsp:Transcript_43950/g.131790  ORF Transcript_43950/g.131790 Transcript_43950/m.131790 type:complete len:256 (+) Transcript_43950:60-827(+)
MCNTGRGVGSQARLAAACCLCQLLSRAHGWGLPQVTADRHWHQCHSTPKRSRVVRERRRSGRQARAESGEGAAQMRMSRAAGMSRPPLGTRRLSRGARGTAALNAGGLPLVKRAQLERRLRWAAQGSAAIELGACAGWVSAGVGRLQRGGGVPRDGYGRQGGAWTGLTLSRPRNLACAPIRAPGAALPGSLSPRPRAHGSHSPECWAAAPRGLSQGQWATVVQSAWLRPGCGCPPVSRLRCLGLTTGTGRQCRRG